MRGGPGLVGESAQDGQSVRLGAVRHVHGKALSGNLSVWRTSHGRTRSARATALDRTDQSRRWSPADVSALATVALGGLLFWFLYVAAQPRDYSLPLGSPDRLDTLFGWRAPGIDPQDLIERDRVWCAMAGWLLIGVVAGRARPRLWALVGPLTVLPTLLVYFATAPQDAEGWWKLNVVYLPLAACVVAGAARLAPTLDWLFRNVVVLAFGVGLTFSLAALMGGGESNVVVVAVGLASAIIVAAIDLVRRALPSRA